MKKIVNYNGETLETIYTDELSQDQYEKLVNEYYKKPKREELINEIAVLVSGGVKNSVITEYYFKDIMSKTKVHYNKWSIEDVFKHKPLLDTFYSKTLKNKNVYTSDSLIENIETAFRLGGKGVASKVANFPIYKIEEILRRYNVNNNWYDMSCGWGARLTTALKKKINYYGTDPNYLLVEKLNMLVEDWKEITKMKTFAEIRCQGSETFVPEWVGKMGLCFTSPPYFNLEDYKIGNQSWKKGKSYQSWLDSFLEPTIKNCYLYLEKNGYLAINVNDFDKYKLVADTERIAQKAGFNLVEKIVLGNINRANSNGGLNDNDEQIMVFMKKEVSESHKSKTIQVLDIFDMISENK